MPRDNLPRSIQVMLRWLVCGSDVVRNWLTGTKRGGSHLRFKHHYINFIDEDINAQTSYQPKVTQLLNPKTMIEPQVSWSKKSPVFSQSQLNIQVKSHSMRVWNDGSNLRKFSHIYYQRLHDLVRETQNIINNTMCSVILGSVRDSCD